MFYSYLINPFHIGGDGYPHPTAVYAKDEPEWEVSGIFQHKGLGGRNKYLVAYSGYNESKAFWLPKTKLHNALEILNDYKVSYGLN